MILKEHITTNICVNCCKSHLIYALNKFMTVTLSTVGMWNERHSWVGYERGAKSKHKEANVDN